MSSIAPTNPPSKALEWTRLIAITGSAQVAVQAIGFVCGILVIRLLPVEEYALYTIANTMLGTMTLLADGGIASGVMSQGGKVWQDKSRLGAVLATGMTLRRQFAVYSLLVSIPILYYLLHKQGASWFTSTMLVLSLMPAFFSALSGKLLEISAKLHQDIAALQRIQVTSNALRLLLSGLTLFVFPFAGVVILATGASQIYGNWRLRGVSNRFADRSQAEDPEVRQQILGIVKRVLPGAVYYSISSQLTVWLIAVFGSTQSVAQAGALSRLAMIFSMASLVFAPLALPRFARLKGRARVIRLRYFQFLSLIACSLALLGVLLVALSPYILPLLGNAYVDLRHELVLMVLSAILIRTGAAAYQLNVSRGYNLLPWIEIPMTIGFQILGIMLFPIDTVSGVLAMSAAIASWRLLMHVAYAVYVLRYDAAEQ